MATNCWVCSDSHQADSACERCKLECVQCERCTCWAHLDCLDCKEWKQTFKTAPSSTPFVCWPCLRSKPTHMWTTPKGVEPVVEVTKANEYIVVGEARKKYSTIKRRSGDKLCFLQCYKGLLATAGASEVSPVLSINLEAMAGADREVDALASVLGRACTFGVTEADKENAIVSVLPKSPFASRQTPLGERTGSNSPTPATVSVKPPRSSPLVKAEAVAVTRASTPVPPVVQSDQTGLFFDERMCLHADEAEGPAGWCERGDRLRWIMDALAADPVASRLVSQRISPATSPDTTAAESSDASPALPPSASAEAGSWDWMRPHLERVHARQHCDAVFALRDHGARAEWREKANCTDIFANAHTVDAALIGCAGVLGAAKDVMAGRLRNALTIVRPPGHHAEPGKAMGFCFFNSVAVAAAAARAEMGAERVLIVDWDVHHGNGTQHIFDDDRSVLYFSVHRYDDGRYYPGNEERFYADGSCESVGTGAGEGATINVAWNWSSAEVPGDAEYLATWRSVLLPAATAFRPDLVIVSAGFDAAHGDTLGECDVSPAGYAHMLHALMALAGGRVLVVLEGGYEREALASSVTACARTLLGHPPPPLAGRVCPHPSALATIGRTVLAHARLEREWALAQWAFVQWGVAHALSAGVGVQPLAVARTTIPKVAPERPPPKARAKRGNAAARPRRSSSVGQ